MMGNALAKVLEILDLPDNSDFEAYHQKEVRGWILAFSEEDWAQLMERIPALSGNAAAKLCLCLSPVKHGKKGCQALVLLANSHADNCLEPATIRLSMPVNEANGFRIQLLPLLEKRLSATPPSLQHNYLSELIAKMLAGQQYTSIAEAQEISGSNKELLERCEGAACYFCQSVFDLEELGPLEDADEAVACPYCGTEAVLPDNLGFDLSPVGLEALNEFWFG